MKLARRYVVALLGLWVVFGLSLGSAQANGVASDRIIVTPTAPGTIGDRTLGEGSEGTTGTITIGTGVQADQFFIHQLDLVEPDGVTFSDHVRAVADESSHLISISFCSDENDLPCLTPGGASVIETGALQDVSTQLGVDVFGITVLVQSDLNAVPEPGTLLLLAAGFGGLVGSAWRRHRRW